MVEAFPIIKWIIIAVLMVRAVRSFGLYYSERQTPWLLQGSVLACMALVVLGVTGSYGMLEVSQLALAPIFFGFALLMFQKELMKSGGGNLFIKIIAGLVFLLGFSVILVSFVNAELPLFIQLFGFISLFFFVIGMFGYKVISENSHYSHTVMPMRLQIIGAFLFTWSAFNFFGLMLATPAIVIMIFATITLIIGNTMMLKRMVSESYEAVTAE